MDEELVNAVLQRQVEYINDLINKKIILEAKLSVVEKQLAEIKDKYEKDQAGKKKPA